MCENDWWDDSNKISKIEVVISDTSDMEIIKIYDLFGDDLSFGVDLSTGVKWVYNHILNKCDEYKPTVEIHDIKTRILKYTLDV